ncbi:prepilin-type N-terminal cleavage/methylation domain-containing protein, partial [bacterium]|nr:prepilin-type N-terminal cleavage/methylation domain-containing protein [bacterium]
MRRGFTLIEVMVAVMIISVVILGLLQLFANNTHIF